ncbi:MAG: EamA family transporter [Lachnospiraceae bacterium]|nr:EamA family transporter [Lachnospiraceae bacterium]
MIYLCIAGMTLMGAVASVFLKKASGSSSLIKLLCNYNLYIGGFLYVASAAINIIVLRYLDYSVVLPLTSFTYIWTMVLANIMLKEKISAKKIVGVMFIIAGAVCVAV